MVASPAPSPPRRQGLSDVDPAPLGRELVACWDTFLDLVRAPSTDLTRPSRLPGWSGADTCVHLGAWPDSAPLAAILARARSGAGPEGVTEADNEWLVAAHRHEPPERVVAALQQARDALADFFAGPAPAELGRVVVPSPVGPLPVLSLLHGGAYELAVHALDLAPCGAPEPGAGLLDRGLAALVDVTGALAARAGVHLTLTAQTPAGGWRFTSERDGWTTAAVPAGDYDGIGVRGGAADLLDVSAGRTGIPQLLLARRITVQDLPGFLRLAPLVTQVPGLPGGAALRTGVGAMTGVTGGVTRLLGRLRR